MSTRFRLLSAAALATLAAGGAGAADTGEDPDAGPQPGQSGSEQQGGNDQGAPKDKSGADKGNEAGDAKPADTQAVVLASEAAAAITAAEAKGFAAANARVAAVFASDEAKKDPSLAAFMLTESNATAENIVAKLKERAPAPAAAGAGDKPAAVIPDTNVNLGKGTDPKALVEEGGKSGDDDGWATAQAATARNLGMAGTPVVPASAAAKAAGAPLIPPTGN